MVQGVVRSMALAAFCGCVVVLLHKCGYIDVGELARWLRRDP